MLPERFWSKIEKHGPVPEHRPELGPCWVWTGARAGEPPHRLYGHLRTEAGKYDYAHRVAYEWLVGPIPAKYTIDHLCRYGLCVNPAHLEPVTPRENVLRSPATQATKNASKTHCIHGHSLEDAYLSHGGRHRRCRTCAKTQAKAYYDAKSKS